MTDQEAFNLKPGDRIWTKTGRYGYIIRAIDGTKVRIELDDGQGFDFTLDLKDIQAECELYRDSKTDEKKHLTCDCGVDKYGAGKHSDYCKKYERT